MNRFLESRLAVPACLFLWPWVGSGAGYLLASPLLLPVLDVLPAYALMLILLCRGSRARAVAAMLWWALGLAIAGTTLVTFLPGRSEGLILNGAEYRDEMFRWIRTGLGVEGDPSRFIPQHLGHLAIFVVLSLATVSLVSMIFGSILMNYMSFYVGSLIAQAKHPILMAAIGWHPWSLFRVAAFVILGVVLAEPLLHRLGGRSFRFREITPFLIAGAVGLAVDIALKALLAPAWRSLLLSAAGPEWGSP